ncbi:hypothetical protein [Microvirga mediterraneensis]|uniref:Uncharacterized protein n=1 Tax=Microvirga mediterraneensis TaxID=2754695 RepID=A0A838BUY2_9HYPH|nr:hypothetical protein [Microvirga mediterraneensis]MBA1159347.1 hypothetical protein [Microvirga mediterraneensis]
MREDKEIPTIICYEGRPITELSREELIAALEEAIDERKAFPSEARIVTERKPYSHRPERVAYYPTGMLRMYAEFRQQPPRLQQEMRTADGERRWFDIPLEIGGEK